MKSRVLVYFTAAAIFAASFVSPLSAQIPASPPGPGLTSVNVPLLLPPQPGVRPAAAIAHVEVKLAHGVGGAVFTQRVPPEAGKVLQAVSVQIEKLHPGKLKTGRIEITYTGSVSAQDLAASGLALAVALDAALGGWTPDPGFMAIGTFEADGDVQPVKDAIPRLLAVMQAEAKRVVMTEKQVGQVTDLMISSGAKMFAGTQFFAVNSYEDVKQIANTKLTPEMEKNATNFGEVQQKLKAAGAKADDVLRDEDVREALRQTMVATPTCLSARLLLRMTTGQFDTLSTEGTLYAIENMAPTIFTTVQSRAPGDMSKLSNAVVQAEIAKLSETKQHFDKKALPLLDAVINYGELMRSYTEKPPDSPAESSARIRSLASTAQGVIVELGKFKLAQVPKRK
jgi:hypothetical protein